MCAKRGRALREAPDPAVQKERHRSIEWKSETLWIVGSRH